MQGLSDDERKQVLGEVLFDELKAIRESLDDVPKRTEFNELKEKIDEMGADVAVIKLAVKDVSRTVNQHDREINILKTA